MHTGLLLIGKNSDQHGVIKQASTPRICRYVLVLMLLQIIYGSGYYYNILVTWCAI